MVTDRDRNACYTFEARNVVGRWFLCCVFFAPGARAAAARARAGDQIKTKRLLLFFSGAL